LHVLIEIIIGFESRNAERQKQTYSPSRFSFGFIETGRARELKTDKNPYGRTLHGGLWR
jgi:hypothetical protein